VDNGHISSIDPTNITINPQQAAHITITITKKPTKENLHSTGKTLSTAPTKERAKAK